MVHAIGDGCLVYEVQQSSNTTYRMFDWNRTDAQGNPRELHIEESLKTIDWRLPVPKMITPEKECIEWSHVVSCEFFAMNMLKVDGSKVLEPDEESFIALFAVDGSAAINCGGKSVNIKKGDSVLIPACADKCKVESSEAATLLVTTL